MKYLSFKEVMEELEIPPPLFSAILRAGLFGYTKDKRIPLLAVEHFSLYGTQWRPELGTRAVPEHIAQMPEPSTGNQPLGTRTHIEISTYPDGAEQAENDSGWVAHFYLRPNPFYFMDPYAFSLNGPIAIKLDHVKSLEIRSKRVFLCPDPEGHLALIVINGGPGSGPANQGFKIAFEIATNLLDELSFKYNQPLHVAHSMFLGVPSGVIFVELPRPESISTISNNDEIAPMCPILELRIATSYYREGLTSSNPFQQFLAFWKCYENLIDVRGNLRESLGRKRGDKRVGEYPEKEVFPNVFAFAELGNKTFGDAKELLRDPLRNAIAHGTLLDGATPKSAASAEDHFSVSGNVPIVRYMAHKTMSNVRATFEKYAPARPAR